MESKSKSLRDRKPAPGFDVTRVQVIGRVEFNPSGEMNPFESAMSLIGQDGGPGTYLFPTEDGGVCEVAVEFKPEAGNVVHL